MKSIKEHDEKSHFDLCQKLMSALKPFLFVKEVKKKETLLIEGNVCKNIYFVRTGAVKQYYLSEGKEFIQNFYFEGNMASHFNSFLTQTESDSYLEAIEGTELWVMSYHNFERICQASPEFSQQLAVLMSKMNSHRVNLLLLSDAMLRYKKFLADEPELLQRVPQYMIASYLGMTPETLSRIRKRLSIKAA
jgi:CRP/FNR family transcriptional regulator, anaerobic regulatory protein